MKHLISTLAVAIALITSADAAVAGSDAQFLELPPNLIDGTPPPPQVKNWIRLNVLGPTTQIPPIVWIVPGNIKPWFPHWYPDSLIALSPEEFGRVDAFAGQNKCRSPVGDLPPQTLQIVEYARRHTVVLCVMLKQKGCRYLLRLSSLPGVAWNDKKLDPLRPLIHGFCYYPDRDP